jgi:hypothetical protein
MTELQQLLAQKKEIEDKIQQIKNQTQIVGRVKIEQRHYTYKHDKWFICIKMMYDDMPSNFTDRWSPIIQAVDKDQAIQELSDIIQDLTALRNTLSK